MTKIITVVLTLGWIASNASAFDYFDSRIDYWNTDNEEKQNEQEKKGTEKEYDNEGQTSKKFDWNRHLDPKNDEFFKEGDYTPPAPFMELVRNPTEQNIANWFALMELKNRLSTRLQVRVREYVKKNGSKLSPESKGLLIQQSAQRQALHTDYKRYRFRLYFSQSCPHCKKMMDTMEKLQKMGFYVELRRLGDGNVEMEALPFPVVQADTREIEEKNIKSTPVLLIGDLQKKVVYRLDGYQSLKSIFAAINEKGGFGKRGIRRHNTGGTSER